MQGLIHMLPSILLTFHHTHGTRSALLFLGGRGRQKCMRVRNALCGRSNVLVHVCVNCVPIQPASVLHRLYDDEHSTRGKLTQQEAGQYASAPANNNNLSAPKCVCAALGVA